MTERPGARRAPGADLELRAVRGIGEIRPGDDLPAIVADAITRTGAAGMKDMGRVMGAANGIVAGRADGSRVAAEVRRQLG